jgi:hypothetical protein
MSIKALRVIMYILMIKYGTRAKVSDVIRGKRGKL